MDYYLLGKIPVPEQAKVDKKALTKPPNNALGAAATQPVPEEELHD